MDNLLHKDLSYELLQNLKIFSLSRSLNGCHRYVLDTFSVYCR